MLSTSEPNGLCYIETAELDGETNLKCKQCLPETAKLKDDHEVISKTKAHITCELPNEVLCRFEGVLTWDDKTYPVSNNQMLLRGCVIRNTAWCYGVVVFAGKDTKLMQNSGKKTRNKRTRMDLLLNKCIIWIICFLVLLCILVALSRTLYEVEFGKKFRMYSPWPDIAEWSESSDEDSSPIFTIAGLIFVSYAILLNGLVPISLYVSIEILRLWHSFWINWDKEMVHNGEYARVRTTTLNDELGQVEYIFSDKTGTLTKNVMVFKYCSIFGTSYGALFDSYGNIRDPVAGKDIRVDFKAFNEHAESGFDFYDHSLLRRLRRYGRHYENIDMYFRLLSLCNTVMPNIGKDEKLNYQAQSPDEGALVKAARNFGYVLCARTPQTITINAQGVVIEYQLLCILDFSNARKRMSVVVKHPETAEIILFTKGADSVIMNRLLNNEENRRVRTITHDHLDRYACDGLRTLVLAYRYISESQYEKFHTDCLAASSVIGQRDAALEEVYNELEQDLILVGASAIEDKLQDYVPDTIANLQAAGIKIWVLTGDKMETAINIGYSAQLLTDTMQEVFVIDGLSIKEVKEQLLMVRASMEAESGGLAAGKRKTSSNFDRTSNDSPYKKSLRASNKSNSVSPEKTKRVVNSTVNQDRSSCEGEGEEYPQICVSESLTPESGSLINGEINTSDMTSKEYLSSISNDGYAIVVSGPSLCCLLDGGLGDEFIKLATKCTTVICCRSTPLQKALIVKKVMRSYNVISLAIGDGANDVSMIKEASVGVGISGQEGMQAVLASDIAISQFSFLQRLLLVHGRWSYFRMSKFMRYFFYKNFAHCMLHFYYAWYCGFTALSVLDPWFISFFNMFYSNLPVLAMGALDQDVSDVNSLKFPALYKLGQSMKFFNIKSFLISALWGIITATILFFTTYYTFQYTFTGWTYESVADNLATVLVFAVNMQIALDTNYWTYHNTWTIIFSIASYFVITAAMYSIYLNPLITSTFQGVHYFVYGDATFWLSLVLNLTMVSVPVIALRLAEILIRPSLVDQVKIRQQRNIQLKSSRSINRVELAKRGALHRRGSTRKKQLGPVRSAYAFSHDSGFARLITQGINFPDSAARKIKKFVWNPAPWLTSRLPQIVRGSLDRVRASPSSSKATTPSNTRKIDAISEEQGDITSLQSLPFDVGSSGGTFSRPVTSQSVESTQSSPVRKLKSLFGSGERKSVRFAGASDKSSPIKHIESAKQIPNIESLDQLDCHKSLSSPDINHIQQLDENSLDV